MDRSVFSYDPAGVRAITGFSRLRPMKRCRRGPRLRDAGRGNPPSAIRRSERHAAQDSGLRRRHRVAEAVGGIPGDATSAQMRVLADAGSVRLRRAADFACAKHRPAACEEGRSLRSGRCWTRRGSRRPTPVSSPTSFPAPARLLRPGDGALDPDRAGDFEAIRRSLSASAASANSASRTRAASTPAAIAMSARSAFSASRRRAGILSDHARRRSDLLGQSIGELFGPGVAAEQVPDVIEESRRHLSRTNAGKARASSTHGGASVRAASRTC